MPFSVQHDNARFQASSLTCKPFRRIVRYSVPYENKQEADSPSQDPSRSLLPLNGLEQCLEVAGTETVEVVALNDLKEHSWSIHECIGENLEKIAPLVEVDNDVLLLNGIEVLCHDWALLLKSFAHVHIVRMRHRDEFHSALPKVGHTWL